MKCDNLLSRRMVTASLLVVAYASLLGLRNVPVGISQTVTQYSIQTWMSYSQYIVTNAMTQSTITISIVNSKAVTSTITIPSASFVPAYVAIGLTDDMFRLVWIGFIALTAFLLPRIVRSRKRLGIILTVLGFLIAFSIQATAYSWSFSSTTGVTINDSGVLALAFLEGVILLIWGAMLCLHSFEKALAAQQPDLKSCHACATRLEKGNKYCPNCGAEQS